MPIERCFRDAWAYVSNFQINGWEWGGCLHSSDSALYMWNWGIKSNDWLLGSGSDDANWIDVGTLSWGNELLLSGRWVNWIINKGKTSVTHSRTDHYQYTFHSNFLIGIIFLLNLICGRISESLEISVIFGSKYVSVVMILLKVEFLQWKIHYVYLIILYFRMALTSALSKHSNLRKVYILIGIK